MAPYTINVRVIDDSITDNLTIVEKACWHYANGCTWTSHPGGNLLTMGGSGTSGMLRFTAAGGQHCALIVGVHNYKVWCDVLVDLKSDDTLVKLLPTYYGAGERNVGWVQKSSVVKTTAAGKEVGVNFYQTEGNQLLANFTYGG